MAFWTLCFAMHFHYDWSLPFFVLIELLPVSRFRLLNGAIVEATHGLFFILSTACFHHTSLNQASLPWLPGPSVLLFNPFSVLISASINWPQTASLTRDFAKLPLNGMALPCMSLVALLAKPWCKDFGELWDTWFAARIIILCWKRVGHTKAVTIFASYASYAVSYFGAGSKH